MPFGYKPTHTLVIRLHHSWKAAYDETEKIIPGLRGVPVSSQFEKEVFLFGSLGFGSVIELDFTLFRDV